MELAVRKGVEAEPHEPKKRKRQEDGEDKPKPAPKVKKPRTAKISGDTGRQTVLISGLGEVTQKVLYKKVRKFGNVKEIQYPMEDDKTKAIVIYDTAAMANDAVKHLDKHTYKGATLSAVVKNAIPSNPDKRSRLIIRNLSFKIRESHLEKILSEHGPVLSVQLPRQYAGGPLRGFAFAWMATYESAQKVIDSVNGTALDGRTVAVDWAISKERYEEAEAKADAEEEEDEVSAGEVDDTGDRTQHASINVGAEDEEDEEEVDENDEDDDEDEIMEEDEEVDQPTRPALPQASSGTILFIRNVPFEASTDELRELFQSFGPLRYVRITLDKTTGHSKGTGFVCFWNKDTAEQCLEVASKLDSSTGANSISLDSKNGNVKGTPSSVLLADPSSSLASQLTLHGRVLNVLPALSRDDAAELQGASLHPARQKDRRNLYLLREGLPPPSNPHHLPQAELNIRQQSYSTRAQILKSNPSLYLSQTRLSIRRLPLWIGDKELKLLGRLAVQHFDKEVKAGKRLDLSDEEKKFDEEAKTSIRAKSKGMGLIKQAKIVRAKDRVDPYQKERETVGTKKDMGRSKGYGFLEFTSHTKALKCLRWLNFNVIAIKVLTSEIERLTEMKAAMGLFAPSLERKPQKESRVKAKKDDQQESDAEEEEDVIMLQARGGKGLMVEFSIENIVVNKRRNDRDDARPTKKFVPEPVTEMVKTEPAVSKSGLSEAQKKAIAMKRRKRKGGK